MGSPFYTARGDPKKGQKSHITNERYPPSFLVRFVRTSTVRGKPNHDRRLAHSWRHLARVATSSAESSPETCDQTDG